MNKSLKNGYYRLTSERASYKSIAQLVDGEWFLIAEQKPVTIDELNRRGWYIDSRVGKMKNEIPAEQEYKSKLKEAVAEAKTYNRMGGLDEQVLEDVALDWEVSLDDLKNKLDW